MIAKLLALIGVAVVTTGCAEEDIVVYRAHGRSLGGEQSLDTSGGAPTASGGSHVAGGPSHGTDGAGGRMSAFDAGSSPMGGNAGAPVTGGTGGDVPTGGAGGSAGRNGGGTAGFGGPCSTALGCAPNFYCQKLDCSSPMGMCAPLPIVCPDATPIPVCGCDGVTYWNDCVRQQNGVALFTPGQCTPSVIPSPALPQARTCVTSADCHVDGASCAHLTPIPTQGCGAPSLGTCWMTPLDCTQTPPTPSWMPCQPPPPGSSGRPACVNTCEAIRSGQEYVVSMGGPVCR